MTTFVAPLCGRIDRTAQDRLVSAPQPRVAAAPKRGVIEIRTSPFSRFARTFGWTARLAIASLALAGAVAANAADLRVLASNAVKEGYRQGLPDHEKGARDRVDIEWGGTVDIARRVRAGEVADVVVIPSTGIDDLIREGWLVPGSRTDLVQSTIGAAVRPGLPKPRIASTEDLKAGLLAAKSVVLSSGPSSVHLERLFQQMGIEAEVKAKTLKLKPGASVAEALLRGEGDLGFTQVSELLTHEGIGYLGPLPDDVQATTVFSAGILRTAPQPEAARRLLRWMTSPEMGDALRRVGLEPS